MAVRVIVLAERSTDLLGDWPIPTGSAVESEPWESVTLELVRRVRQGWSGRGEVFLCLLGDAFECFDHSLLERLGRLGSSHMWGSELFVVIDPRSHIADQVQDLQNTIAEWFDMAQSRRITVLEAPCPAGLTSLLSTSAILLLRDACDRARRYNELCDSYPSIEWSATVAAISPRRQLQSFVQPYLTQAPPSHRSNLLVIIKESQERTQVAALRELLSGSLRDWPRQNLLVATLVVKAKNPLSGYCHDSGLHLIHFPGPLELRSFLQRVNAWTELATMAKEALHSEGEFAKFRRALGSFRGRLEDSAADRLDILAARLEENLEAAELYGDPRRAERWEIVASLNHLATNAGSPSFTSFLYGKPAEMEKPDSPTLLVTHAFDPDSEPDRCLRAAGWVGSILEAVRQYAPAADVQVHLGVTCSVLQDMLGDVDRLTAWVFLGPAEGPEGLWDCDAGQCITAERWEACFLNQKKKPGLALFLAGHSQETARHFASHGVACAIGLAGELPVESVVFPLNEIFRYALTNGVDCHRIEGVLSELSGAGEPRVFCAGHS